MTTFPFKNSFHCVLSLSDCVASRRHPNNIDDTKSRYNEESPYEYRPRGKTCVGTKNQRRQRV